MKNNNQQPSAPNNPAAVADQGQAAAINNTKNDNATAEQPLPSLANNKDLRIAGKYIIGDKIGSGAFGDIYVGKK